MVSVIRAKCFEGCPEVTTEDEGREPRDDGRERPVPSKYLCSNYKNRAIIIQYA